jgi:hypothetical protein
MLVVTELLYKAYQAAAGIHALQGSNGRRQKWIRGE